MVTREPERAGLLCPSSSLETAFKMVFCLILIQTFCLVSVNLVYIFLSLYFYSLSVWFISGMSHVSSINYYFIFI